MVEANSLKQNPESTVQANRLSIRQIEGKGIGYGQGYTTLEAFLTPFETFDSWLPFADLRGHRFDNNKFAFNAGVGFRALASCMLWGANVYYDYRQTRHLNYKQIGVGLEALGAHWDYRINGYLPIGKRESGNYQTKFDKFEGHTLFIKTKREFDMCGANAEVAYHWMPKDNIDITAGLGPYYFHGKFNKYAAGGQGRLKATFLNAISIEGIGSYDNLFKWNGQGQLTFSIPLCSKLKTRGIAKSCCDYMPALDLRVVQPVQRFEIIVADSHEMTEIAINPATGQPFNFIFVNNTSHSQGTFESPYNTLLNAQNNSKPFDIIYVYQGDGTSTGMNAGITLQYNQKLWGAGIPQHISTTIGNVTIPPTQGLPTITNTTASANVITCANNNEISGMHVLTNTNGQGIGLTNISNAYIHRNVIDVPGSNSMPPTAFGVNLLGCGGTITFEKNTINQINGTSIGFALLTTAPQANYFIYNNQFNATVGGGAQGIAFGNGMIPLFVGDFDTIKIIQNTFTGQGSTSRGIAIGGPGFTGVGTLVLDHNTFAKQTIASMPMTNVLIELNTGASMNVDITNNVWKETVDNSNPSFFGSLAVGSVTTPLNFLCLKLHDNISDYTPFAYTVANFAPGGTFIVDIANNVGVVDQIGPMTPGSCP
jgi:hypothetical protein